MCEMHISQLNLITDYDEQKLRIRVIQNGCIHNQATCPTTFDSIERRNIQLGHTTGEDSWKIALATQDEPTKSLRTV